MSNLLDSFDDHGVCARCKRYFEKKNYCIGVESLIVKYAKNISNLILN